MDINHLRIAVTIVAFALFVGLMLHTWNRRRGAEHEQAANLPFDGESAAHGRADYRGSRHE